MRKNDVNRRKALAILAAIVGIGTASKIASAKRNPSLHTLGVDFSDEQRSPDIKLLAGGMAGGMGGGMSGGGMGGMGGGTGGMGGG